MEPTPNQPWLHRFALFTALATLALLGAGGLVTSHGVGMAVPDWPNTYGYNIFLFPASRWIGGIFYEHTHRLIGAFVGLLTTLLAAWLWVRETRGRARWAGVAAMALVIVLMGVRRMPMYLTLAALAPVVIGVGLYQFTRDRSALRWLGLVAFAAVILQGVLGGLRVVWFKDEIGIFHATLAQLFFLLISALALLTSRWWEERHAPGPHLDGHSGPGTDAAKLRRVALWTTVLILIQLVLGATMRHQHAGLAIPDFPLAYGKLWPAMDPDAIARYNQNRVEVTAALPITAFQIVLQMAHRLMALLILIGVGGVTWLAERAGSTNAEQVFLRRLSRVWLVLILAQAGLGAWTVGSGKAADVATAHVLTGALSLVTGGLWCIIAFRRLAPVTGIEPAATLQGAMRGNAFGPEPAVANK